MSKKRENKSLILKLISLNWFRMDFFFFLNRGSDVYLVGGQTSYISPLISGANSVGLASRSQLDSDPEEEEQGSSPSSAGHLCD